MKNCKNLFSVSVLFIFIFVNQVWGAKIVYPWRSTTAIVKAGENFEVWFDADVGQTVNSVELQSPYIKVDATITNLIEEEWVYDEWSGNTCNLKLTVSVDANTPADRYDLILKTSTGDEISLAAVKVIKEYKTSFYIFHISDAHRWQGGYDPINILRRVSTTVDIANIINPAVVVETGDNHYPNTNNESSTIERINDYMNGFTQNSEFIKGMNHFYAPVFTVPGNHDTPQKNYQLEPDLKTSATYYNKHYGLQAHNFTYGNARFIGVNNAWFSDESDGIPNFQHQTDAAIRWLEKVGKGDFRIGYCHVNSPIPQNAFYGPLEQAGAPLDLIMVGHCHNSLLHSIHGYPDVEITHSVYPLREEHRKAPFNLYKVNMIEKTYEPVGNIIGAHYGLETATDFGSANLKLTYSNANDGSNASNVATIVNQYDFPIDDARVRFVVPKGSTYYVLNGTVTQKFDGTSFRIIDIVVDLEEKSTTVVEVHQGVRPDNCPDDPNKMDPGNCGCGVPEGTCDIPVSDIMISYKNLSINLLANRQLSTTISPKDATNKEVVWTTSDPNVATVNSDGVVTAISEGTATITATTVDGGKTATSQVTVIPNSHNYQAEHAELEGAIIATNQPGFNGSGFADYSNPWFDYIKWSVYVPTENTYTLTFRYALAKGSRPLQLSINGKERIAKMDYPPTGSFATWGTYTIEQQLVAGNNTITLTAIGSSGGNFDELTINQENGYTLTVNNGSGGGTYTGGEHVVITADEAPEGKEFDRWSIESGYATIINIFLTSTFLTMPEGNVEVTATYKDKASTTAIDLVQNKKQVHLYPNPISDDTFMIDFIGFDDVSNIEIKITNILGKTVYSSTVSYQRQLVINANGILNESIYFVNIKTDKEVFTSKLVVR